MKQLNPLDLIKIVNWYDKENFQAIKNYLCEFSFDSIHRNLSVCVAKDEKAYYALCLYPELDVNYHQKNIPPMIVTASIRGKIEIMKDLFQRGADINIPQSNGVTALMLAYNAEIKDFLLCAGADVNCINDVGDSCLTLASYVKKPGYIQELISYGADVNYEDSTGQTPFIISLYARQEENLMAFCEMADNAQLKLYSQQLEKHQKHDLYDSVQEMIERTKIKNSLDYSLEKKSHQLRMKI